MKKVYQEITTKGEGDCFSACVASLLEIELKEVPNFNVRYKSKMMEEARKWFKREYAISLVSVQISDETKTGLITILGAANKTECIFSGESGNVKGGRHAVVGELSAPHGLNFKTIHDPNPKGKGIIGNPTIIYFLIPMSIAAYACIMNAR